MLNLNQYYKQLLPTTVWYLYLLLIWNAEKEIHLHLNMAPFKTEL